MAKKSGRELIIKVGSTPVTIAAVRSKSVAINNERIDTTNDDSGGWQEGLTVSGLRSVEITVSGLADGIGLRATAYGASPVAEVEVTFVDGAKLEGDFFVTGYTESGEHDGAIEFEATFASNEEPTYTAAVL